MPGKARFSEHEERMWSRYSKTRSVEDKNNLVKHYIPLAKLKTGQMAKRLPSFIDLDEVYSWSLNGLNNAIESFDLGRGVKFETYCGSRIIGEVLDGMRMLDHRNRTYRRRQKLYNNLVSQASLLHDDPSPPLELIEREIEKLPQGDDKNFLKENPKGPGDEEIIHLIDHDYGGRKWDLPDTNTPTPLYEASSESSRESIVKGMNGNERRITILYYYEELTMKQIGEVLDLSESRVSQIHGSLLGRLKSRFKTFEDAELEMIMQRDCA